MFSRLENTSNCWFHILVDEHSTARWAWRLRQTAQTERSSPSLRNLPRKFGRVADGSGKDRLAPLNGTEEEAVFAMAKKEFFIWGGRDCQTDVIVTEGVQRDPHDCSERRVGEWEKRRNDCQMDEIVTEGVQRDPRDCSERKGGSMGKKRGKRLPNRHDCHRGGSVRSA